jgi:hypothetical protein
VRTRIEAGDGSCNASFLDPRSIKVKTRHEREESSIPSKDLGRTITWPEKTMSRSREELGRNDSV